MLRNRENYLISNAQFAEKVQAIKLSEEKYRLLSDTHTRLLDHLSTVVMEIDMEGRIVFTNQAWTKLTGFSEAETKHCSLSQFANSDVSRNSNLVGFHIENISKGVVTCQEVEFQIKHKSGELLWVKSF